MERQKKTAIDFATWIEDGGWIRDPFPREDFKDNNLRYPNIATIDIHSDDKLQLFTIEELYAKFEMSAGKNEIKSSQPQLPLADVRGQLLDFLKWLQKQDLNKALITLVDEYEQSSNLP